MVPDAHITPPWPTRSATLGSLIGICGLALRLQGTAKQPGRDIDDRNDALISHSGGPDNAKHAHGVVLYGVGGSDDTTFVQKLVPGLLADKDLDTVRI